MQLTSTNQKLSPVEMRQSKDGKMRPVALGPFVSSTYVSIAATCPDSCQFKGAGCYVTEGFTKPAMTKLDRSAPPGSDSVYNEAMLIGLAFRRGVPQDGARSGRDLRLHVGGDVVTAGSVEALAGAAKRWKMRGGGAVWTFTHRWREIPRWSWGTFVSVLASVESYEDARTAMSLGYAPALVVPRFPSDRVFETLPAFSLRPGAGPLRVIPCPAETRGKTCVECRLCLDDSKLRERGVAIGFAIHGRGADAAKRKLAVMQ